MRKGSTMLRAASTSATGADTPSSVNDCCDTSCSTPLLVRDLPTSKHPKEEREAHLTGRHHCRPCSQSSNRLRTSFLERLATLAAWLRVRISAISRLSRTSTTG